MSTAPFPGPYPTTIQLLVQHFAAAPHHAKPTRQAIRRQSTPQQGRSLERLGHAIEYLVDSQLYLNPGAMPKDEAEAIQILMRLSREVFAECREIVPIRRRLKLRLLRMLTRPHPAAAPTGGIA